MADNKASVSFDEIIQKGMSPPRDVFEATLTILSDRARRKNEDLAKEIFGRNKQNKDAANKNSRSSSRTPSLASRMGVAKVRRMHSNVVRVAT